VNIKDLGGEHKLIETITSGFRNYHRAELTVGDDAAIVRADAERFAVLTTDVLVEGDHFNCTWSTPKQIGRKTIEVNASDVAAMGARPQYLLLNLVLREGLDVDFAKELYAGILEGCEEHRITLLGGDTTRGAVMMVSATMSGVTTNPVRRSGAVPGDLIAVTGDVGASNAGYLTFRQGLRPVGHVLARHLEPRCRLDVSDAVAGVAHAMIDVSDGVASEIRHIAARSVVGARVDSRQLPIHPETAAAAKALRTTAAACALSGGEDFELLFTLAPDDLPALEAEGVDLSVIGEVLPAAEGLVLLGEDGEPGPLPEGYDHFA